jgi:hypothetical protein
MGLYRYKGVRSTFGSFPIYGLRSKANLEILPRQHADFEEESRRVYNDWQAGGTFPHSHLLRTDHCPVVTSYNDMPSSVNLNLHPMHTVVDDAGQNDHISTLGTCWSSFPCRGS